MTEGAIAARIVRLHLVADHARARLKRRVNRSSTIYSQYNRYYGKGPKVNAHWTLEEDWDGRPRRWCYDDALNLETEAAVLVNMLEIMLLDARQRRTTACYTSKR